MFFLKCCYKNEVQSADAEIEENRRREYDAEMERIINEFNEQAIDLEESWYRLEKEKEKLDKYKEKLDRERRKIAITRNNLNIQNQHLVNQSPESSDINSNGNYRSNIHNFNLPNLVEDLTSSNELTESSNELTESSIELTQSSLNSTGNSIQEISYMPEVTQIIRNSLPEKTKLTCLICLNNISTQMTILKCKHIYHPLCLEEWMLEKKSCPICNISIG